MKLFLDRNKTLLPQVDTVYLVTRCLILLSVAWLAAIEPLEQSSRSLMWAFAGTFAVHLGIFAAATKGKFDLKLAYLSAIIHDLLLVPILILFTDGVDSSFYLLHYLTLAVAAYILTFWFATAVLAVVAISYVAVIAGSMQTGDVFDVALRLGFMVVFFLTIVHSSKYMRRSERRLLNLFNTLNKRTSELEKSQSQLQVIYENTRALASILDLDGVVKEVVRLMGELLQLRDYAVIFREESGDMYYRARVRQGVADFHRCSIDTEGDGLLLTVCELEEAVRVKDLSTRNDYKSLSDKVLSVMLAPLVSRGVVRGVLVAESTEVEHFQERDLQMLVVVARSAALALDNAELHRRMEELSVYDELTQTFNYRYFIRKLEEERRRAFRYDLPLSLVMVDIDHFKKLNDTHGHENGNLVLKKLSSIIKGCIRDVDVFARYGGEEFAIILPQTGLTEAVQIGERIRSRVEASDFELEGTASVKTTVSVGVSCFPENGQGPQQLVKVADEALYQAKGDGRNLVRTA